MNSVYFVLALGSVPLQNDDWVGITVCVILGVTLLCQLCFIYVLWKDEHGRRSQDQ